MNSFEMIYDGAEDVLEVTFETVDENFSRSIPLNEEIVLHTDANVANAWGLTLYNYAQLLQVTETHLDAIAGLDAANLQKLLRILASEPISHFLNILDTDSLRALVKAPRINDLI